MSLYHRLKQQDDLAKAVSLVNRDLLKCLCEGQFVTLCVGIWDSQARTWTYCAAGHPGGIVRAGGQVRHLDSTGPLLGVLNESDRWQARQEQFQPGDLLLLYSDGAIEAGAPTNMLGADGLAGLVRDYDGDVASLPKTILAEAASREPSAPSDDITVVAIQVAPK